MQTLRISIITSAVVLLFLTDISYSGNLTIGIESGLVSCGYNDVRIPNATGTKLSLTDDLSTESEIFYRLTAEYKLGERHSLAALFAPLTLEASGRTNKEILYNNTAFPANSDINAKYTFNSYRLTYRYTLSNGKNFSFGLGLTGKIRDAAVVLETIDTRDEYTNIGFVPLINFRLEYHPAGKFGATLEGDALAAPQGRAEDVALLLNYRIDSTIKLDAGYRVLEGGADVDDVYSFALLHYLVVCLKITI